MSYPPQAAGITKLSQLEIDAAMDWKGYGITNFGSLELASGAILQLEDSLADNLAVSGLGFVGTAGETLTKFQTVYRKDAAKYWKAQANSATTMPVIAMAAEDIAADEEGKFIFIGWFRMDALVLTPGAPVYQSAGTAGAMTTTKPAAAGNQAQRIGVALTITIVHFNPIYTVFEMS